MYDWDREKPQKSFRVDGADDGFAEHGLDDDAFDTSAIDSELQAAIEYKIAVCGVGGVSLILELVRDSVKRHT